jgi:transposase InsO family protein
MTDGYDCYQNALAERVNGILKGELLLQSPQDLAQAREMVREAVDIYNLERPHHALKYRTPMRCIGVLSHVKLDENV